MTIQNFATKTLFQKNSEVVALGLNPTNKKSQKNFWMSGQIFGFLILWSYQKLLDIIFRNLASKLHQKIGSNFFWIYPKKWVFKIFRFIQKFGSEFFLFVFCILLVSCMKAPLKWSTLHLNHFFVKTLIPATALAAIFTTLFFFNYDRLLDHSAFASHGRHLH